jgi:hypothetical protein
MMPTTISLKETSGAEDPTGDLTTDGILCPILIGFAISE